MAVKSFIVQASRANPKKLFDIVIYFYSIVLLQFCVIKQYYCSNYQRMAVNYQGKKLPNIGTLWQT
jgi:hypothetical protein